MSAHWDWTTIIILTAIAMVGGSLGYAARTFDAGEKFRIDMFLCEGIFSAFFGFLISILNMELGFSIGTTGAFVGVLSWSGSRAMLKFLQRKVNNVVNDKVEGNYARDDK